MNKKFPTITHIFHWKHNQLLIYIKRNIYKGLLALNITMENIKRNIKNWFERLFKNRYLDINLLNQLKEKGITPLFSYDHTQYKIERRNK